MTNYSSIPSEESTEQPMELTRRDSSVSNLSFFSSPHKYLAILALITSAFFVGRYSFFRGGQTRVVLPQSSVTQLCEIYHSSPTSVIQTSRGEPSKQWKEVGCIYRERRLEETSENVAPSAVIDVSFKTVPFGDRSPILGFGGAFTEAAALNYGSLSEEGKLAVMDLLFGKEGLGYSLGRTHINSCDFSIASYSHDDTEDDFALSKFDNLVSHDLENGMIDMMLSAASTLMKSYPNEEGMKIVASPWSPPAWMKAPRQYDDENAIHASNMTGSAEPVCLRDGVGKKSKSAKSWALFFSKWVEAYANHGIDIYGVTVQNEPEFAAPWDACAYDILSEGDFIANHLGPQLKSSHPNVKLFIFDHNKDHIVNWTTHLLANDHPAREYIDGTAFHWYAGGLDRLLDGAQGTANLHRTVSALDAMDVKKDHILFGSEGCHCPSTGYAGGDLNIAWARATRNAHALLADLSAGSNGFIEWNLILDSIGGPNHLGNMCDSPLLAVPHRAVGAVDIPKQMSFETAGHPFGKVHGDGKTREELNAEGVPAKYLDLGVVVQPMYYYVGHITKFVRPGSRAVHAIVDSSAIVPKERTFRPKGKTVAGGGINDLAREGIEVTLWPCEGSTRQQWKLNDDKQIQVFGHDWLGVPTSSCLAKKADKDMGGLMMSTCNMTIGGSGYYEIQPVADSSDKVNIVLTNGKVSPDKSCLVVQPLKNNGGAYGPRGGAQVNIGDCSHEWSQWTFDTITGEISSTAIPDGEVCLTTGWPFLQVGAFDTSAAGSADRTIVVLNEAWETANFVLKNEGDIIMSSSIPPQSIQTILFDHDQR